MSGELPDVKARESFMANVSEMESMSSNLNGTESRSSYPQDLDPDQWRSEINVYWQRLANVGGGRRKLCVTQSDLQFSDSLRSFHALSMTSESDDSGTLEELQKQISALQRDREELVTRLTAVDLSLSRAQADYCAEKNRSALISTLPNELLANIFEFARNLDAPGDIPLEIVVSQVTARWRAVAIESPSLWNVIVVSKQSNSSHILATYVARAKAYPLEVKFDFRRDIWVPEQFVWDLLVSTVDRWRSLAILAGSDDAVIYNTLAHLEPLSALALEELHVEAIHDGTAVGRQGFRNAADCFRAGASRLTCMHLGVYLSSNWPPLTHLTTLHLHKFQRATRPNWQRFRALITSPSNLLNLSLYGDIVRGRAPDNFGIGLPHLRSLRIRGTGLLGERASDLLLSISAPYLQSLTLYDVVDADLIRFFGAVPAPLLDSVKSLTIYYPNFKSGEAYLKLSSILPSVTSLTVFDRWSRSLLIRLGLPQVFLPLPDQYLWPLLTDFALYTGNKSEEDVQPVQDMIASRSADAPLQRVRFGDGAPMAGTQSEILPFDLPPAWPAWPECR
ncbi:hypothetical protein C8F01DRAFT_85292 [Mycena amicta]|nr:hypothetical protein C8F01DRAFT_85292 [Mycena amicta]